MAQESAKWPQEDVLILAIETSCDETAAAVVKNGREVLSNIIYSQIDLHTLYGGVVPEIASRKHIEKINQVIEKALTDAKVTLEQITAVAVTYGPGLVGFPNVGKSTFLSMVTNARPKIANYHFTTLNPNLGVVDLDDAMGFVIADIPGLIEGASEGIGLGHDFLRHVERCRFLVHILDGTEENPMRNYKIINSELAKYSDKI